VATVERYDQQGDEDVEEQRENSGEEQRLRTRMVSSRFQRRNRNRRTLKEKWVAIVCGGDAQV
jgi:hypothetical protein